MSKHLFLRFNHKKQFYIKTNKISDYLWWENFTFYLLLLWPETGNIWSNKCHFYSDKTKTFYYHVNKTFQFQATRSGVWLILSYQYQYSFLGSYQYQYTCLDSYQTNTDNNISVWLHIKPILIPIVGLNWYQYIGQKWHIYLT